MNLQRMLGLLVLFMLLAVTGTVDAATVVNAGSVNQFTGPADLALDPPNVVYAINFSADSAVHTVGGVVFAPDVPNPPGTTLVGPQQVTPWQTKPEYGGTADDDNLEAVMQDIRWANAGGGETLRADLAVNPGSDYRLQLLISGNNNENRIWDIEVDGVPVVDEITSLGQSPGQSYSVNRSTEYRYDFTAPDGTVNVVMGNLFGANDGGDRNAIWQGLILTERPEAQGPVVPEPSTFVLGALGLLALGALCRRRR